MATRELTGRAPMKVLTVVGTRPNFVKIAPLIAELDHQPGLRPILVHTGQHYRDAMSDHFFSELGIRQPDFDLGVGTNRVIGTDPGRIAPEVLHVLDEPSRTTIPPPLWDCRAACRIVEILLSRQIAAGNPSQLRGGDATWQRVS
jgi:UDP-N-acetylglucosamine 2-epimerase